MPQAAQKVSDDDARLRLLEAVKAAGGDVTPADLVARTGLPPHVVDRLLGKLVAQYESEIDVDDDGNLLYRFDPDLNARPDIVKADRWRRRKAALVEGARRFFRAWTVVMIVLYAIVFAVLLVAALARGGGRFELGGDRGRRRRRSSSGSMSWWMLIFGTDMYVDWSRRRRVERRQQVEKDLTSGRDPYDVRKDASIDKPSLIDRTWYWLFGHRGIHRNPLEREKELLTYIRAKKGLVTNADIMALLGVTYDEADRIGTRLCAAYDGALELTDDAVPVYRFENLMVSGAPEVARQAPDLDYAWQIRQKEQALKKHTPWVVLGLNGFNLLLSFVAWFKLLPMLGITGLFAHVALVWVPMAYSVIFYAIGGVRALRDKARAQQREREDLRLAMYRLIFAKRRTSIIVPGDEKAIGEAGLGWWRDTVVESHVPALTTELRGDMRERPDGRLELVPERVLDEMRTVEELRRSATNLRPIGKTVFSTTDEDYRAPVSEDLLAQEIEALESA